jgi:hypothetical protein
MKAGEENISIVSERYGDSDLPIAVELAPNKGITDIGSTTIDSDRGTFHLPQSFQSEAY